MEKNKAKVKETTADLNISETTIRIGCSHDFKAKLVEHVKKTNYRDVSQYLRHLIQKDIEK